MYCSSRCVLSLSTHNSFPCIPLSPPIPPFLVPPLPCSLLYFALLLSLFAKTREEGEKGKRGRRAVSMSMCTCLFTVHAHVYTPTVCGECVWQHVCIPTNFPLDPLFILPPAKNSSTFSSAHVLSSSQSELYKITTKHQHES